MKNSKILRKNNLDGWEYWISSISSSFIEEVLFIYGLNVSPPYYQKWVFGQKAMDIFFSGQEVGDYLSVVF